MVTNNAWNSQDPAQVAKGGSGAATLTGVLTGNGTSPFTANAVTQHGVVIGGASNAVGSTAVGTATYVLTSNGAGMDPTFQVAPGGGSVVQVVTTSTSALISSTSEIPFDDSIPQSGEGVEVLTLAITPTSASNLLFFQFSGTAARDGSSGTTTSALFQDSTANALAATGGSPGSDDGSILGLCYSMTAGTTMSTTFKIRAGYSSGEILVNGKGSTGTRAYGGVASTKLTIWEIEP